MDWIRARFYSPDPDDFRPIKWPPPGPYWCSGFNDTHAIIVAYVKTVGQILEFWPGSVEIDGEAADLEFTDRFPRPSWWKDD